MAARLRRLVPDLVLLASAVALVTTFGGVWVCGRSMEPALRLGDLVVYRRGQRSVATGDMVVLGDRRASWVHRVVRVTPRGTLVTRGDANRMPDLEETSTAAVRGRVVAVLPLGALGGRLAASGR